MMTEEPKNGPGKRTGTEPKGLPALKRRLAAVLLAAMAVLTALAAWYYAHHRAVLRSEAERLLLSTSQVKLDQILNWREERLSDARSLSESPFFAAYLRRAAREGQDGEAAELIRQRLDVYLQHERYSFAAIADRGGRVLICSGGKPEAQCPQFRELIPVALTSGGPWMGDFYLSHDSDTAHIDIVAPLGGDKGRERLLLLRADPSEFLYPLLQEWTAKGETGEILLVSRQGSEVVFLNDLRHVRDAAMRLRLPLSRENLPAAMGAKGFAGVVRGLDYRGVEVLAAVAPVPGTTWTMVTKLDMAEVVKGSGTVAVLLALLIAALLAAAGGFTYASLLKREEEHVEELRRSETFIRSVMDNLPIGIAVNSVEPQVEFEYMNDLFPKIYGTTREELGGSDNFFEAVYEDPGFRNEIKERVLADCASGDPARMRWPDIPLKRGGRTRYISALNVPLPDKGLMVSMVEDVTERKLAEIEKDRLNSALVEKNREMENFLYITSHDLRGPLVNIQGFGQNLAERLDLAKEKLLSGGECDPELNPLLLEKMPRDLGFITESAAKMDRLITALLQVSRLGRSQLRPVRVDMNVIAKQAVSGLSFRAEQAGAEINFGELPPCFADLESMSQIFTNLLENAIKYRHPDRKPVIEISGRAGKGRVFYEVRDNGAGITASEQDKIWQIFYRASASGEGEGVGLSIVRTLTERNGGRVDMRSEPGKGSVFTLELPAEQEN